MLENIVHTYQVDLDDLARAFPERFRSAEEPIPPLLRTFGNWFDGKP